MSQPFENHFGLTPELEQKIPRVIHSLGFDVTRPAELAREVIQLSTSFNSKERVVTPWGTPGAQAAYLAYFFPLQYSRNLAVRSRGEALNFFSGFDGFVDFGSGPGCASLAYEDLFSEQNIVEISAEARSLHQKFTRSKLRIQHEIPRMKTAMGVFSYVLNELGKIPDRLQELDGLVILEPSTHQDFLGLEEIRTRIQEVGFHIWAPCTHQMKCPLRDSRDWCHDRIHFVAPSWWQSLEAELPMKNKTITFSYLLARKAPAPHLANWGRLTGDVLQEKGKTRQLVCRGSDREFLSWLHREGEPPNLERGQLIELDGEWNKKSNELRGGQVRVYSKVPAKPE